MKTAQCALLLAMLSAPLLTQPVLAQSDLKPMPDGPPSAAGAEARYKALIDNSPWFRHIRESEECGTIGGSDLRAKCIQSFGPVPKALPVGFVAPPPVPTARERGTNR